ncbi:hypothetical protein ACFQE5_22155 [Pseudonocardia hispaniensis]|uniref:Excreted virulence factor EspC (Type VII ESX diderm) n=1 Tax=Pseudonocardia hispaniensis TaxID=904933 RepID=A0ABW1J8B4_9PSEU
MTADLTPAVLAEDVHAIADRLDALGAAGACAVLRQAADRLDELDAYSAALRQMARRVWQTRAHTNAAHAAYRDEVLRRWQAEREARRLREQTLSHDRRPV